MEKRFLWMKKYNMIKKEKYVLIQFHANYAVNSECRIIDSQVLMLENNHSPHCLLRQII